MVVIRYSPGAGTVLGLFFDSIGLFALPSAPTPPRPGTIARFGVKAIPGRVLVSQVARINKKRCDFLRADYSGHGRRRGTRNRQAQARISGGRCTRRRRPVLARSGETTTTASRASYAGRRELHDTEWATPAPASPRRCRASLRRQHAAAAPLRRWPRRASAWPAGAPAWQGARASPRSA